MIFLLQNAGWKVEVTARGGMSALSGILQSKHNL
jgi:hypothetical protein